MKIVICQCSSDGRDPGYNIERIERSAKRASAVGADLVIFPELMLSGYNIGLAAIERVAENANGSSAQIIAGIAREYSVAIAYGYPERAGENVFNAASLVDADGNCILNYRKTHLFGQDELSAFTPGDGTSDIVPLGDWQLGMLICYDVEFPEAARLLALDGADLIVVPTALMSPYERIPDLLVPARAYENQIYVAYANYCGEEGNLRYCGKSTLAAPNGRVLLQANQSETLIVGELSRPDLTASRELNTYLRDRRPTTYARLVD